MNNLFAKAVKEKLKGRLALVGPAGTGKTYTGLKFGAALAVAAGGRLAVIDTEAGSAKKYADLFDFDLLELSSYEPETYSRAIRGAAEAGYGAVLVDSLSHAWSGKGGALEQVDKASRKGSDNRFTAWRDVTPKHNELVDTILRAPLHVLATMRSKTAYDMQEYTDNAGRVKTKPVKIGLAPIQREGMDYEFDVVGELDASHTVTFTKSRFSGLQDVEVEKPDGLFLQPFIEWLNSGQAARVTTLPVELTEEEKATWRKFLKESGIDSDHIFKALGTVRPSEWLGLNPEKNLSACIDLVVNYGRPTK